MDWLKMKLTLKLENGYLTPYDNEAKKSLEGLKNGIYEVSINNMDLRTLQQNRALHKYFSMLSEAFNEQGQTVPKVLKIETRWTPEAVKELLWKPIQLSVVKKKSTAKLNKDEINKVYEVLSMALGKRMGIYVEFPSEER